MLYERVRKEVMETLQVNAGDGIVIGVSGGADSMTLLDILREMRTSLDIHVHVVHLNHGFRGDLADRDMEYVRNYCLEHHIDHHLYKMNIEDMAKIEKVSFEEMGRKVRYGLFEEVRIKTQSKWIAVAHNKNDQAETFLMHLFRGSGLDGLAGISKKRDHIIRPLLNVSRSEIEHHCMEHQIKFMSDHTNEETIYTRNKIRLELIKEIESAYCPQFTDIVFRTTQMLREDSEYLERVTNSEFERIFSEKDGKYSATLNDILGLDPAIKGRIFRHLIKVFRKNIKNFSKASTDELICLVKEGKHGTKKIFGDVIFEIEYNQFVVHYRKDKDQLLDLSVRYKIEKKIISIDEMKHFVIDETHAAFDADKIMVPLSIRNRLPGDRFWPLGSNGHKKLKDFLIDLKIPQNTRDSLPLICAGNEIIWLYGVRISDKYKVEAGTKRVMLLSLHQVVENN